MIVLFIVTGLAYGIGAVLMALFWSRIPPHRFADEVFMGIFWPLFLPMFLVASLINCSIRAIHDPDGEFAGLYKDSVWVRERKRRLPNEPLP